MFFSEWDDGQLLRVSPPFSFVTMDGPFFPVFPSASFSSSSPPPCRHAGGRGNSERLHLAEESPHFRQREAGERATVEEGTRGERGKEGGLGEKSSPGPLQGEGNPSGDRFSPSVLEKTDDSYEGLRQRETSISRSSSERQARHGSRHRRRAERKPLGSVPCGQAGESTGEGKRRFRFGSEIVPLTSPLCSGGPLSMGSGAMSLMSNQCTADGGFLGQEIFDDPFFWSSEELYIRLKRYHQGEGGREKKKALLRLPAQFAERCRAKSITVFIPPLLLLKDLEEKRDGSSLSLQLPVLLTHLMMLIPTDGADFMSLSQKDLRRDFCLKTFGQRSRVLQLIKAFRLQHFRHSRYTGSSVSPLLSQQEEKLLPFQERASGEGDDLRIPSSRSSSSTSMGGLAASHEPHHHRSAVRQQSREETDLSPLRVSDERRARSGRIASRRGSGCPESSTEKEQPVNGRSHPYGESAPSWSRRSRFPGNSGHCCGFNSSGDAHVVQQWLMQKRGGVHHTPQPRTGEELEHRRTATAVVVEPSSPCHFQRFPGVMKPRERGGENEEFFLPDLRVAVGGEALRAVAFSRHGCSSSNSSKSDGTTSSEEDCTRDFSHQQPRDALLNQARHDYPFPPESLLHRCQGVERREEIVERSRMKGRGEQMTGKKRPEEEEEEKGEMEKEGQKGNGICRIGADGKKEKQSEHMGLERTEQTGDRYRHRGGEERPDAGSRDRQGPGEEASLSPFSQSSSFSQSQHREMADADQIDTRSPYKAGPSSPSSRCLLPSSQHNNVSFSPPPSGFYLPGSSSSSSSGSSLTLQVGAVNPSPSLHCHVQRNVHITKRSRLPTVSAPPPPSPSSDFSFDSPSILGATRAVAGSFASPPPVSSSSFSLPVPRKLHHPVDLQRLSNETFHRLRPAFLTPAVSHSLSFTPSPSTSSPAEPVLAYPSFFHGGMTRTRGPASSTTPLARDYDSVGLNLPYISSRESSSSIPPPYLRARTRRRCILCCRVLDVSQRPSLSSFSYSISSSPKVTSPRHRRLPSLSSLRTSRHVSVSASNPLGDGRFAHRQVNPSSVSSSSSHSVVNSRSSRTSREMVVGQSSSGSPGCLLSLATRGCISFSFLIPLEQLRFCYPLPISDRFRSRSQAQGERRRKQVLSAARQYSKRRKERGVLEEGEGWEEEEEEPTPPWWRGQWLGKDVAIRVLTVSDLSSHFSSESVTSDAEERQSSFPTTVSNFTRESQQGRNSYERLCVCRSGRLDGGDGVPDSCRRRGNDHGAGAFCPSRIQENDKRLRGTASCREGAHTELKQGWRQEGDSERRSSATGSTSGGTPDTGCAALPSSKSVKGSVSFLVSTQHSRSGISNRKLSTGETDDTFPRRSGEREKEAAGLEGGTFHPTEAETKLVCSELEKKVEASTNFEEPILCHRRGGGEHRDRSADGGESTTRVASGQQGGGWTAHHHRVGGRACPTTDKQHRNGLEDGEVNEGKVDRKEETAVAKMTKTQRSEKEGSDKTAVREPEGGHGRKKSSRDRGKNPPVHEPSKQCRGLDKAHRESTFQSPESDDSERRKSAVSAQGEELPEATKLPPCSHSSPRSLMSREADESLLSGAFPQQKGSEKPSPSPAFANIQSRRHTVPSSARNFSPGSLFRGPSRSSSLSTSLKNFPSAKHVLTAASSSSSSFGSVSSLLSPKCILILHIYRLSLWRHPQLVLIFGVAEGPCVFCGRGRDLLWLVTEYVTRYSLEQYFDTPRESSFLASMDYISPSHGGSRNHNGARSLRGKDKREERRTHEALASSSSPGFFSSSRQITSLFRLTPSRTQRDRTHPKRGAEEREGEKKISSSLSSLMVMPPKAPRSNLRGRECFFFFSPGFHVSFYPWKARDGYLRAQSAESEGQRLLADEKRRALVSRRCRLSVQCVVRLARGIAFGCAYLHHKGMYHVQLRPDKVLTDAFMNAKLTGFFGLEDFQFSCRRDRVNSRVPSSLFSSSASRPLPPAHSCPYYPHCPVSPSSFYYSFTSSSPRPRHEHSRSHNISSSSPSTQAHSLSLPPDLSNYHRATLYERASSSSSSSLPARAQICAYHLPGAASMPTRAYPPPELLKESPALSANLSLCGQGGAGARKEHKEDHVISCQSQDSATTTVTTTTPPYRRGRGVEEKHLVNARRQVRDGSFIPTDSRSEQARPFSEEEGSLSSSPRANKGRKKKQTRRDAPPPRRPGVPLNIRGVEPGSHDSVSTAGKKSVVVDHSVAKKVEAKCTERKEEEGEDEGVRRGDMEDSSEKTNKICLTFKSSLSTPGAASPGSNTEGDLRGDSSSRVSLSVSPRVFIQSSSSPRTPMHTLPQHTSARPEESFSPTTLACPSTTPTPAAPIIIGVPPAVDPGVQQDRGNRRPSPSPGNASLFISLSSSLETKQDGEEEEREEERVKRTFSPCSPCGQPSEEGMTSPQPLPRSDFSHSRSSSLKNSQRSERLTPIPRQNDRKERKDDKEKNYGGRRNSGDEVDSTSRSSPWISEQDNREKEVYDFLMKKWRATGFNWASPEELLGYIPSPYIPGVSAADIYSFGVILWQMVSGCIPFQFMSPAQIIGAVAIGRDKLPDLAGLFDSSSMNVPLSLRNLIRRCSSYRPYHRPSFREVIALLSVAQEEALHTPAEDALREFMDGP